MKRHSRRKLSTRRNPRIQIHRGELTSSYEPHDLPGAFIITRFKVKDSTGAVPDAEISWNGPGEWITSREGVPKGYKALWLGTRETTRPFVVFVSDTPTKESDEYDKGYRKGFKAKRKPGVTDKMSRSMIDGVLDGWKDSPNRRRENPDGSPRRQIDISAAQALWGQYEAAKKRAGITGVVLLDEHPEIVLLHWKAEAAAEAALCRPAKAKVYRRYAAALERSIRAGQGARGFHEWRQRMEVREQHAKWMGGWKQPKRKNPDPIVMEIKRLLPKTYSVRKNRIYRDSIDIMRPPKFDHLEWARLSRMLWKRYPQVHFSGLAPEEFCRYWLDLDDASRRADLARREAERARKPLPPLEHVPVTTVERALRLVPGTMDRKNPKASASPPHRNARRPPPVGSREFSISGSIVQNVLDTGASHWSSPESAVISHQDEAYGMWIAAGGNDRNWQKAWKRIEAEALYQLSSSRDAMTAGRKR